MSDSSSASAAIAALTCTTRGATEDPCVGISIPTTSSVVTVNNMTSFTLSGTCSHTGQSITLNIPTAGGAPSIGPYSPTCSGGVWSQAVTFTIGYEVTRTLNVTHGNGLGPVANASVNFSQDTQAPSMPSLSINGGNTDAYSLNVSLSIASATSAEMYISNTSCVAGGSWETYSASKSWTLGSSDSLNYVYIKTRDAAGNESSCNNSVGISHHTYASVTPVYASNGANWNDYIHNSTPANGPQGQADSACVPGSATNFNSCIHAGELKKVVLTGYTSCTNLSLSEQLGAFDWFCSSASGTATFYSSSLKLDKGLGDLIDSTPTWRANRVAITTPYETIYSQLSTTWWGNTVTALPDSSAGVQTLATAGSIYVMTANSTGQGYNLNADNVAIVGLPSTTLQFNGSSSFSCNNSTGETTSAFNKCLIASGGQKYLWIEMNMNSDGGATDIDYGLLLSNTQLSMIRNVEIYNSIYQGLYFSFSNFNRFVKFYSHNNGSSGMTLYVSNNNLLLNNIVEYNSNKGLDIWQSSGNTVQGLRARSNSVDGISVAGSGTAASNNHFTAITSVGNTQDGIEINGLSGPTSYNRFHNVVLKSNTQNGVYFAGGGQSYFSHIASANNGFYGVKMYNTTSNKLSNVLKMGNNSAGECNESGGTTPGLDSSCIANGSSNFSYITGADLLSSLNALLNLVVSDLQILNRTGNGSTANSTFTNGATCPSELDGNIYGIDNNSNNFLINAIEAVNDNTGNDDGFCQSNETCLYTPNFGAYQGHGTSAQSCTFQSGTITGVSMVALPNNGY